MLTAPYPHGLMGFPCVMPPGSLRRVIQALPTSKGTRNYLLRSVLQECGPGCLEPIGSQHVEAVKLLATTPVRRMAAKLDHGSMEIGLREVRWACMVTR